MIQSTQFLLLTLYRRSANRFI